MSWGERLRRWARAVFTLDLRSLALFRIGLGLLIVVDAWSRSGDVALFYGDRGISPRPGWERLLYQPSLFSLVAGDTWPVVLLLLLGVSAALLAIGWRTRVVTILTWLLLISVQNRTGSINSGADWVLASFSLYACFLPLGARFSVDAWRRPALTPAEDALYTPATAAVVLQVIIIYFFNAISKYGYTWIHGTAVLQALHIDQHTTAIGKVLRDDLPWLSPPLTWGTLVVEGSVVLLLLSWRIGLVRRILFVAFWGLHLGLASCMYLGLFSPVCMVVWLALLPQEAWQKKPLAFAASLSARGSSTVRWTLRSNVGAGILLWAIASQIVLNTTRFLEVEQPALFRTPARALAVDQPWRLFAANPSRNDGWFVFDATLASGLHVDPFRRGSLVTYRKPALVGALNDNTRWRKLMMNMAVQEAEKTRRRLAVCWCREWNRSHDDKMVSVEVFYMSEETRRDFAPPPVEKKAMGKFRCPPL